MGKAFDDVIAIAIAIVGLAILAVIFARGSSTATVIQNLSSTIATSIRAAVSPATGL